MENYSITKTELWAYISKTADTSTKLKVEEWMQSSEYDDQLFREIESIYKTTGNNTQLPIALNTARDRFFRTVEPMASNSFQWKRVLKYAAIIVFIVTTTIVAYQKLSVDNKQIIVQTTFGEHKRIDLSDGSTVWLNASSKLSYLEMSPRQIHLEGEAFFEVAKDKEHPFVVSTNDRLNVKALGTSFNVKAYADNSFIETVLFTGKVEVTSDKHFKDKLILLPKDKIVFLKEAKKIIKSKEQSMESIIAWKEGRIQFKNKPFNEIIKDLSIQYNIKIDIKTPQLSKSKFTGSFDASTPVSEILETLKLSKDFEFKQVDSLQWFIK